VTTEVVRTTSGDAASSRPTAPVVIGGKTYTALCPKMAIWIRAVHEINEAAAKSGGNALSAAQTLHDVLVGDDADKHSTGVLVQALEPEDIAELTARLTDRRDDLDMDSLWFAAIELLGTFEDWVQARGKEMGLKIPKLVKVPKAAPAAAAPAPRKRAPAKTTARKR
jgi:hypothetical protein